MEAYKKHYIAVIGGSISGSEAANLLAQNGFKVVVFEMNKLPYGDLLDITEGTASWHYYQWVRKVGQKSVLI